MATAKTAVNLTLLPRQKWETLNFSLRYQLYNSFVTHWLEPGIPLNTPVSTHENFLDLPSTFVLDGGYAFLISSQHPSFLSSRGGRGALADLTRCEYIAEATDLLDNASDFVDKVQNDLEASKRKLDIDVWKSRCANQLLLTPTRQKRKHFTSDFVEEHTQTVTPQRYFGHDILNMQWGASEPAQEAPRKRRKLARCHAPNVFGSENMRFSTVLRHPAFLRHFAFNKVYSPFPHSHASNALPSSPTTLSDNLSISQTMPNCTNTSKTASLFILSSSPYHFQSSSAAYIR
ncbi:hypothetical protein EDB19DRAFT_1907940 [Suillus lakei]|nr:hypothetical protein EDB19DRAFT_1907940 [Suillus lakei]